MGRDDFPREIVRTRSGKLPKRGSKSCRPVNLRNAIYAMTAVHPLTAIPPPPPPLPFPRRGNAFAWLVYWSGK